MIKLKSLIEGYLLEEIGEHTSLYHRSSIKLSHGDIVKPRIGETGTHWLEDKPFELALEYYRKENAPNKPSRLNCVYSSLIPRSRFVDKGYLYEIKPKGKIHVVDSKMIDEMADRFDRDMYDSIEYRSMEDMKDKELFLKDPERLERFLNGGHWYWKGTTPNKSNIKNIEILSDSAVVVQEIREGEKSIPFRINDDIIITEDNKVKVSLDFYINTTKQYEERNKEKKKPEMSMEEMVELKEWCEKKLFSHIEKIEGWPLKKETFGQHGYYSFRIHGSLKKDAKLKIIHIRSSVTMGENPGKYDTIMFDFYKDGELISRNIGLNKKDIYHRFITAQYLYRGEDKYNFWKYLKKI